MIVSRWIVLVGTIIVVGIVGCSAFAADNDVDGVWVGKMRQVNVGSETTYPMRLTLSGAVGETDYPSLRCGGRLARIGTANGHTVYSETIVRGRIDQKTGKGCIDGFAVVRRHRSSLVLEWSGTHEGRPYVATAVLKKGPI